VRQDTFRVGLRRIGFPDHLDDEVALQSMEDLLEQRAADLWEDPTLVRYARRFRKRLAQGKSSRLPSTPLNVVGELRAFQQMIAAGEVSFLRTNLPEVGPTPVRFDVVAALDHAVPYIWTADVCATLRAAPPLKEHVIDGASFGQHNAMYWDNPGSWILEAENGQEVSWNATMIKRYSDGMLRFVLLAADSKHQGWISVQDFPPGDRYEPSSGATWLEDLLKREAFLRSPYVVRRPERVPAPIERKLRGKGAGPLPDVSVIDLRRPTTEGAGEPTGRRYDRHRWWVTGHVRQQWYPSEKAHRLIYVQPHLKGPPDAPLKRSVYRVRR